MNATQALTKLRKLLGRTAGIRDDKVPSSPELRARQGAARREAIAARDTAAKAAEARRAELLAADEQYQRLALEHAEARKRLDACPFPAYRYSAGTVGGAFFSVAAEADSLAELVEKVEAKNGEKVTGGAR